MRRLHNSGSVTIARARILYHDEDDKPAEPFLDEWSKFAELKPHWLSRMREVFGNHSRANANV